MSSDKSLRLLIKAVADFANESDGDRFHTPKHLAEKIRATGIQAEPEFNDCINPSS